jgi:multicomponent Na+:H+ antiporter subunit B
VVDIVLLGFLAATAIAIVRLTDLFGIAMLSGIYSLLSASVFVELDAVDVAFTEAAVGAGISTILMVGTLALTHTKEAAAFRTHVPALFVVVATGLVLVYGTRDLPAFGSIEAPINRHVAPYYLEKSIEETTVPNVVTSVLASYRGYDTLGETTVIFTAGVGVLVLLGAGIRRRRKTDASGDKA